jgi:hypothetical protein
MRALCLVLALFAAGCAKDADVTVVKPHLAPGVPAASTDRIAQQKIRRALKEERSQPFVALSMLVDAAAISARQLDRNRADSGAGHDYNFAVARICGIMRKAKLTPWRKAIQLGTRTLAWQPHPRAVWNPAFYD